MYVGVIRSNDAGAVDYKLVDIKENALDDTVSYKTLGRNMNSMLAGASEQTREQMKQASARTDRLMSKLRAEGKLEGAAGAARPLAAHECNQISKIFCNLNLGLRFVYLSNYQDSLPFWRNGRSGEAPHFKLVGSRIT